MSVSVRHEEVADWKDCAAVPVQQTIRDYWTVTLLWFKFLSIPYSLTHWDKYYILIGITTLFFWTFANSFFAFSVQ